MSFNRPEFLPLVLPDGRTRYEARRDAHHEMAHKLAAALPLNKHHTVDQFETAIDLIGEVDRMRQQLEHDNGLEVMLDQLAFNRALRLCWFKQSWRSGESIWLDEERFVKQEGSTVSMWRLTPKYRGMPVMRMGNVELARLEVVEDVDRRPITMAWRVHKFYHERAAKLVHEQFGFEGYGL